MSLQFKFSVHPCILIRLCCLIFFSKYLFISLAALNVKFTWYLHSLSIHSLNFFFISGHLLHTPYNSNFFQEDLSYLDSTVFTRQNAHSNWGGRGGGVNTKAPCNFSSREGVRNCDKLMFCVLLQLAPTTLCTSEYDHFVKKSFIKWLSIFFFIIWFHTIYVM